MRKIGCICLFLLTIVTMFGCASSTTIRSIPGNARVLAADGRLLGVTPYQHWDRTQSDTDLKLIISHKGYKTRMITIKKDVLYIHRFFLPPVLAWPWLYGYDPEYTFELDSNLKTDEDARVDSPITWTPDDHRDELAVRGLLSSARSSIRHF